MPDMIPYPWDNENPPDQWPEWIVVPEVNTAAPADGSVLSDTIRHCVRWKEMSDSSKTTTAHECTHGINAEMRNKVGVSYETEFKDGLSMPITVQGYGAGQAVNAFYVLNGRGVVLNEPGIRKRDVAKNIPSALRGDRFSTYITGQPAWDGQPLYIFDEWSAYVNGARCGIDMVGRGQNPDKSDLMRGPLEFSIYSLALMASIPESDRTHLLPFFRWQWLNSWWTYRQGKPMFPFSSQDQYEAAFFGAAGAELRNFAAQHKIKVEGI